MALQPDQSGHFNKAYSREGMKKQCRWRRCPVNAQLLTMGGLSEGVAHKLTLLFGVTDFPATTAVSRGLAQLEDWNRQIPLQRLVIAGDGLARQSAVEIE